MVTSATFRNTTPLFFALLSIPSAGWADEAPTAEERLKLMAKCARDIVLAEHVGERRRTVVARDEPAQRFDDASRGHPDGTLWLWGESGRPTAAFEIFVQYDRGMVFHTGHSLSVHPLSGTVANGPKLETNVPGVTFRDVPRQPDALDEPKRRLLRFRALARSFDVHEFWDPDRTRYELRLMPRPVHRYSNPDEGIVDGAVFVFANGTNPEALLLLELQASDDGPRWRCAIARMGHAELHASFDGDEVWQRPLYRQIPPGTPYWMVIRQTENVGGDE